MDYIERIYLDDAPHMESMDLTADLSEFIGCHGHQQCYHALRLTSLDHRFFSLISSPFDSSWIFAQQVILPFAEVRVSPLTLHG